MTTDLIASARFTLQYVVAGLTHHIRAYVKPVALSGSSTTLEARTGGTIPANTAAGGLAAAIKEAIDGAVGDVLLEQRVGSVWIPEWTFSTSGAGTGSNATARQMTLVLRAMDFTKMRVQIMESGVFTFPAHFNSYAGMGAADKAVLNVWCVSGGDASYPIEWQVSRSNNFLFASPFVGMTTDLNDKVRRARGLQ